MEEDDKMTAAEIRWIVQRYTEGEQLDLQQEIERVIREARVRQRERSKEIVSPTSYSESHKPL